VKRKKSILRRLAWAIVLLAAAGGLVRWKLSAKPGQDKTASGAASEPAAFTTAARKDIEQFVLASGLVSPERQTEVKSEVSALIASVKVQPGDQVVKGQMLAELDRRELESQVNEASLRIESTRLQAEKARQDLVRKDGLHKAHLSPDKEYDDARIDAALADNAAKLEQARLETLRQQLTKTTILAPIDGVVLNVEALEGAVIVGANSTSAGTPLMKIANLSRLLVRTEVNEVDVSKLSVKLPVQLSFDSMPGVVVEGVVQFVSPSATEKERGMSDRGEARGFPIIVSFPLKDARIRPGMSANLKIPVAKAANAVALDLSAVFLEEKQSVVYVAGKTGAIERRLVELGINDNRKVEITKGLTPGERVSLTRPASFIPKGGSGEAG
jgi:HlyD family secretion protein